MIAIKGAEIKSRFVVFHTYNSYQYNCTTRIFRHKNFSNKTILDIRGNKLKSCSPKLQTWLDLFIQSMYYRQVFRASHFHYPTGLFTWKSSSLSLILYVQVSLLLLNIIKDNMLRVYCCNSNCLYLISEDPRFAPFSS